MESSRTLFLFLSVLLLTMCAASCDYTDYGSMPLPKEDGDDETTPLNPDGDSGTGDTDGDDDGALVGGTLDEPIVVKFPGISGEIADITLMAGAVTGEGCATPAAFKVIDGDEELAEEEVELEAEVDGDEELAEEEAELEAEVDGDEELAEVEAEQDTVAPDGDMDDEVVVEEELEPELEVVDYGNGPEVVFQISLSKGDELIASVEGPAIDGLIYTLDSKSATAACSGLVDNVAGPGKESFSLVAPEDTLFYLVLDTKAGASGALKFDIEIKLAEGGNPPADGKIGAACTKKEDCESNYCLTSQGLAALLGSSIDIPNGYCSDLGLFGSDCNPDACNETTGGICLDGGFMGPSYENMVKICVRPCDLNGDCRIADSNVCVDPQDWVDAGLLSAADKESYFGDQKFCLPAAFVDVMEDELRFVSGM